MKVRLLILSLIALMLAVFTPASAQDLATGSYSNIRVDNGALLWTQGSDNYMLPPVQSDGDFKTVTVSDSTLDVLSLSTATTTYSYGLRQGVLSLSEKTSDGFVVVQPGAIVIVDPPKPGCDDLLYVNRATTATEIILTGNVHNLIYFSDGSLNTSDLLKTHVQSYMAATGCNVVPNYQSVGDSDPQYAAHISITNATALSDQSSARQCQLQAKDGNYHAQVSCEVSTTDIRLLLGDGFTTVAGEQLHLIAGTETYVQIGGTAFLPLTSQGEYVAPMRYVRLTASGAYSGTQASEVTIKPM